MKNHAAPIDSWRKDHVAASPPIIRTMVPRRSDQRARLKNAHHKTTANAAPSAHCIPSAKPLNPGMTAFTPNRATNSSPTATTPGHSRSGRRGVRSLV